MGEHRRNPNAALKDAIASEMARRLVADLAGGGRLVEGGFEAFLVAFYSGRKLPDEQLADLRKAWYLSADHLFFGIMGTSSEGQEITEKDVARMAGIDAELTQFRAEMTGRSAPTPKTPQ